MNSKIVIFAFLTVKISLVLISSVNAFIVYLRPPKMTVRMNVTPGEYSSKEATFEVKNLNNQTFNVEFIPQGEFEDHVVFNTDSRFDLEPGEGTNFTFEIRYDQPGTYEEIMSAKYRMEGENPVNLEADITIIANEVENPNNQAKDFQKYTIIAFISLVIIITVSVIFIRRGVKK